MTTRDEFAAEHRAKGCWGIDHAWCKPDDYPPTLWQALDAMDRPTWEAFEAHLFGGTSADWLSGWLKRFGQPVSATTIRNYRRLLASRKE